MVNRAHMFKKLASGGVALLFLASPVVALATVTCEETTQGCTAAEYIELANPAGIFPNMTLADRIRYLQKAIATLTQQITKLGSSNTATTSSSCLDITNALIIGSTDSTTNGEVSKLQRFLGLYKEHKLYTLAPNNQSGASATDLQPITGYYGTKTAQSVMEWQKDHGMDFVTLKSGVGPMTRAKLRESCSTNTGKPTVEKIAWVIEKANPGVVDDNDYRKSEQAISVDVTFEDKTTKRFSVGKAYGCAVSNDLPSLAGKKVLGFVNCYMALVGTGFTAYVENGRFVVERGDESAKDGSVTKTVVLEI